MTLQVRQGEVGYLDLEVHDRSGGLADVDAGTLAVSVTDGAGVLLPGYPNTSAAHVATGLYRFNFDSTGLAVGRYVALWTAQIAGEASTAPPQDIFVIAAATITAADLAFAESSDLGFTRGDTALFRFAVALDNQALDLTGATVRFTAKRSLADVAAVFSKTVGDGLTVVDAVGGLIDLTFNPPDTRDLDAPTTLVWDLEVTEANGHVSTPLIGTLRLEPDVREAGVGVASGLLVGTTAVRALVKTSLDDAALADVIAREEAILAAEIGPLAGTRTETFVVNEVTAVLPVRLRRPATTVTVTEDNFTTADIRLAANGRTVSRLATTGWGTGTWTGVVEVTSTPNDAARVTSWVIELVRSRLAETGFDSETRGAYSYTRGSRSHDQVLADAAADILGRSAGRAASRRVRSGVMSSAPSTAWVGTSRP